MHFHARILLAFGCWLGLVGVALTAPALKYSNTADICGITTVYVTVPAVDNTINLHLLPTTSLPEYGLPPTAGSTGSPDTATALLAALASSPGTVNTPAAYSTTTIHQTVSLTHTTTEPTITLTETIGGEDSSSTSSPINNVSQVYASGIDAMSSTDGTSRATRSVSSALNDGIFHTTKVHPTIATSVIPVPPAGSTTCTDNEGLYNHLSSVDDGAATGFLNGATSVSSEVYIFETLTVVPLASIPSTTSIAAETTITTAYNVVFSTLGPISTEGILSSTSSVYGGLFATTLTGAPGSVASGSPTGIYSIPRVAGWNISLPFSTGDIGASISSFPVTGFSSTPTVGPLSSSATLHSSSSSKSINFSNSHALSIPASSMAAHSGFTAFPTSSNVSTSVMLSASSAIPTSLVLSLSSTSLSSNGIASSSADAASTSLTSVVLNSTLTYLPSTALSTAAGSSSSDTQSIISESTSAFSGVSPTTAKLAAATSSAPASTNGTYLSLTTTSSYGLSAAYAISNGTSAIASSTAAPFSISSIPSPVSSSGSDTNTTSLVGLSKTSSTIPSTLVSPSPSPSPSSVSQTPSNTLTLAATSSILSFVTSTTSSSPANSTPSGSTGLISASSATSASATTSPTATSTSCGEQGSLTLNFDDLPPLSTFDNSTAQPMPLFSPYHQFFFSDGFTVVPPPTDPYLPSSGRLLSEFYADPAAPLNTTASIGNGPAELLGCFNFNVIGLSVGCDSLGPDCDWQFAGFRYNNIANIADQVTTQILATPACPTLSHCNLVPITLDDTFQNLTEVRIHLTVAGEDKIWWMDDLNLSWFDSSCSAGLCRQGNK